MIGNRRRFVLGRCLGRGSFGEVYAATMRSTAGLETPVAVKLLRADLDLGGDAVRRLRDEGRLLARLNHPAILKVYDLVTLHGRLALITELVEGADLADLMAPRIPPRALLQALGQVAGALDAAYGAPGPDGPLRLVHRDVKPSNIRIVRHGQAKLLDFGVARFDAADREVRTASDLVVGSVPFMAPERFIERAVEPSSDVFSVGCTLYEGLTGERLYGTAQVAQITGLALQPDRYERVIGARIAAAPAAAGVRELLGDLTRFEPERRPAAAEVATRLETLADQIGGPTLRMWCREQPWEPGRPLRGSLEGQTLVEGALEEAVVSPAAPAVGPGPVLHPAPRPTLLPGTLSPVAQVPPLAPAPPSDEAATRLDRLALAPAPSHPHRPHARDSVWERPYTAEQPRPALPISAPPAPAPAAPASPALSAPSAPASLPGRAPRPGLALLAILGLALAALAALTAVAVAAAGLAWAIL